MKKLFSLNDWTLNKKLSPDKRMAIVSIYLKHPDWRSVAKLEIADRRKFKNSILAASFKKLIDKKYFDSYELIGTKKRPSGVKAKISFASLLTIAKLPFIGGIYIKKLAAAGMNLKRMINKWKVNPLVFLAHLFEAIFRIDKPTKSIFLTFFPKPGF